MLHLFKPFYLEPRLCATNLLNIIIPVGQVKLSQQHAELPFVNATTSILVYFFEQLVNKLQTATRNKMKK